MSVSIKDEVNLNMGLNILIKIEHYSHNQIGFISYVSYDACRLFDQEVVLLRSCYHVRVCGIVSVYTVIPLALLALILHCAFFRLRIPPRSNLFSYWFHYRALL